MSNLSAKPDTREVPPGIEEARSALRRTQVRLSHQYARLTASELLLNVHDGEAVAQHAATIQRFQSEVEAFNDALDLFRFNFGSTAL